MGPRRPDDAIGRLCKLSVLMELEVLPIISEALHQQARFLPALVYE